MPSKLLALALAVTLAIPVALAACGGGGGAGSGATKNGKDAVKGSKDDDSKEPAESEPEVDLRKAACADGTCFVCGDGVCPKGFYCDEKAPGGAACAWLPECAKDPSCACVKSGLEGCSCEERAGGIFASCQ